jgi:ComF family protein
LRAVPAALFNLVFPDGCRLCGAALRNVSRIPVCPECLAAPAPFIAEHFCSVCRTPFLNSAPLDEQGRCGLCRRGLTGFDTAFSYGEYTGTLRKLIHVFKYSRVSPLSEPLGRLLVRALPRTEGFDAIVPMPLHWTRRWKRGFNQSELLARVVSRRTGIPVANALRRRKPTPPQAGLTSAERRTNVSGAFEIRSRDAVRGRSVLLIDDVLTTGATAAACARALKRGGADRVTALTLARVDRRKGFPGKSVF